MRILITLIFLVLLSCNQDLKKSSATTHENEVRIVGAMRNVMIKGELQPTLDLDTLPKSTSLYGLGPVEYLRGEVLVLDGHIYSSFINGDSVIVRERTGVKAPFFVYTQVADWESISLPDSVNSTSKLEKFIFTITQRITSPFAFRLDGRITEAHLHVVNLADDVTVRSPQDAHRGQRNFKLTYSDVTMLGFFSTRHQTVFTHHDSYVHIHLIDKNKQMMGHLDDATFNAKDIKLRLPANL